MFTKGSARGFGRFARRGPDGTAVRGAPRKAICNSQVEWQAMAKSQDRKKETKKKPAKTLEEKRAAKREKKQNRGL